MRKTKKLVALVLAMVFVVAFMAMNVSAAAVEPRANCSGCGAPSSSLATEQRTYTTLKNSGSCLKGGGEHNHYVYQTYNVTYCRTCGTVANSVFVTGVEKCPYA